MKKYLINTLAVLLLGSFIAPLKAQEPITELTNVVPPDAEVAKLGSFGEFGRNLATGQLGVSVPLHTFEGLSLKYPISFSYDPTGIRVQERATCVGLNWNLVGIGVITKTVVGKPDESNSGGYNTSYIYANEFTGGTRTPNNFNDKVYLASQGFLEMEPDHFSFSFNGRSGKFYYDPATGVYHTMPYSKMIITKNAPGNGGEFQVVDEKGYKYIFDRSSDTNNEYGTIGSGQDFSDTYTSQWYLSKIYAPDGNLEFSFEYLEGPLVSEQISESQTLTYLESTTGCGTGGTPGIMPESAGSTSYSNVLRKSLLLNKVICPMETAFFYYKNRLDDSLRLDSVSFTKNGVENQHWKLYHNYYTNANKLRLDSVCQYTGQKRIGKYGFEYDPGTIPAIGSKSQDLWGFNNGKPNTNLVPKIWYGNQYIGKADRSPQFDDAKAGILTKIYYPTGGSSEFVYELNDYGSSQSPDNLENEPIKAFTSQNLNRRYATEGNGTSTLTFTLDQTEVITFNTFRDQCNNRTSVCSNEPCTVQLKLMGNGETWSLNGPARQNSSQQLQLQPGTYTVQVTTYEYQEYGSVTFSVPQTVGYNKKIPVGGLRIKKVINYDPSTNQSTIRKFQYLTKGDAQRSSGTILSKPNFVYKSSIGSRCAGSNVLYCESWMNRVIITSNSSYDISFSDGNAVAYTRVVESIGENGEGGSTEHIFSYSSDNVSRMFPFAVTSSRSWRRGLPKQTSHLTAQGDTISKEINDYTFEARNFHQLRGYKTGLAKYCIYYAAYSAINIADMDYTSEWFYLKKNRKLSYTAGQPSVEEVTEYNYDNANHILASSIKKKLSNGNFTISRFKYPLDYSVSSGATDPAANALYKMQVKNMIDYPVEQTECNDNGTTEIVKKSTLFTYKEFATNGIYNSKLYDFVSNSPINYTSLSSVSGNVFSFNPGYEKVFEAANYNTKGQLLEFENKAGLKKSFLYHSNGILPIAAATNAAANQIYYNGFEESTLPTMSTTSKYGKKSNNQVFVVPGTAVIAGNYTKSWWEQIGGKWVYQSVPIVHNGSDNIVFGAGGLIDNLAVYPKDAELESFDYDLSEGLLNKVKANGNGVQFQYDSMLRLKHVKDHEGNIIKSNEYHYKP